MVGRIEITTLHSHNYPQAAQHSSAVLWYKRAMDLAHEMRDDDYYKFLRFQRNIFTTLQERGYYLKGIKQEDLDIREQERLTSLVYVQWQELLEFEKN